jgi:alkylation response protein AidB-like acyl-CoA dehydrogenase
MNLSAEQTMVRDMAPNFARERLAPHAAERDRLLTLPRETIQPMGELGLLAMLVPEEWGGAAVDHVAYALAIEEIGAGDGSVSTIVSVHNSVACVPILRYGTATQIDAARLLVLRAAALRDAGQPCLKEAAMAKPFASEMAERVCSASLQVLSGYGYLDDFPVERIYRDARVCQIYEGTSDVQACPY